MEDYVVSLVPFYEKIRNIDDKRGKEKILAIQKFNESLIHLGERWKNLVYYEEMIYSYPLRQCQQKLSNIQLIYVDKIEAFFEHVYVIVSSLSMLLNAVSPHEIKRGMPISENKKFLEFLSKSFKNIDATIALLEMARVFRAKIVHVSQHVLYNWMTYSFQGNFGPECCIIYFRGKSDKIYHREYVMNPHDVKFQPPIDCTDFYVSPPHKEIFNAIKKIIPQLLKQLS